MKIQKHAWIIWGIVLIAFVVLMIVIPFSRTVSWWIAAASTILMFCLCAFSFALAFRRDQTLESKVLGWPIFKVGYTALIFQLIVGAIIMGIAAYCPAWAAVIAEVIVFAVSSICMIIKDAAREAVRYTEASVADKTAAWKAIRTRAASIATATNHPELKKLAEEIRYADPNPTSMDGEIAQMLERLSSYADAENIKKAFVMMAQRKNLAKEEKSE